MKPLVGVTVWRRDLNTSIGVEPLQTLATHYTDSLVAADMTPILFPSGLHPTEAGRLVAMVDGVLLSGGDDIDPATYGAENTDSKGVDKRADDFEIAVIEAARSQDKPVLAICRGLQILNVALGGTLAQDVLSPGAVHETIDDNTDIDELQARRHVVHLEDDSIIAGLYGSTEAKVNSLHHQGIGELSPELIVEGRTEDGLVEAARCRGDWWALGVQWHPERMDGEHQDIFDLFREKISGS